MDLQPQASFIPKRPLTSSPVSGHGAPSILSIIATFIFVVSILAAAGVFGYTLYLNHQLSTAKSSLDAARAAYDPNSIQDLIRLNSRIEQAKQLLAKHVAPSALFSFLEANTLSTVRFTQMGYSVNPDGSIGLTLTGNAADFASVALQSDQFSAATKVLSNIVFSGLSIDPATGIVRFQVSANINSDTLLYSNSISSGSSVQQPAEPATQTPATPALPQTGTQTAASSSGSGAPKPIPPQ